jgi:hypothetical protein
MDEQIRFQARSIHVIAPDRIYRVELYDDALYFLRVGGQFDLDRGGQLVGGAYEVIGLRAVLLILFGREAFFRKRQQELIARDITRDPATLLDIHPHNFRLTAADIERAAFLPKKRFLSLVRPHHGRLVLDLLDGERWEFHFERSDDLRTALTIVHRLLADKLTQMLAWDEQQQQFTAAKP